MEDLIDINDRLPDHNDYVLIVTKYGEMQVLFYSKDLNSWYLHNYTTGIDYEVHYKIKYWMPLPKIK